MSTIADGRGVRRQSWPTEFADMTGAAKPEESNARPASRPVRDSALASRGSIIPLLLCSTSARTQKGVSSDRSGSPLATPKTAKSARGEERPPRAVMTLSSRQRGRMAPRDLDERASAAPAGATERKKWVRSDLNRGLVIPNHQGYQATPRTQGCRGVRYRSPYLAVTGLVVQLSWAKQRSLFDLVF